MLDKAPQTCHTCTMINKMQTLYKIDTRGKLREWTCVVDKDSFYAIKGLVGMKLTQDKPTKTLAKNVGRSNATTDEEQAHVEAKAKWDKKLKEGYALTPKEAESKRYYEPMLAQKFEDRIDRIEDEWNEDRFVYSQPKLDGIRCIVRMEDGKVVARTRKGRTIDTIPHILNSLKDLFDKDCDAVLDGELYNHDLKHDFNKIVSLVRKQNPTKTKSDTDKSFQKKLDKFSDALKESKNLVQYWIYDVPKTSQLRESEKFSERFFKTTLPLTPYCRFVKTDKVENKEELDEFYGSYMGEGYEGQMIRINAPYENKRSATLLKHKDFMDAEYRVVDIEEGNGNRTGTAKHIVCYCDKTEQNFNSNIKGNFEYLAEVLNKRDEYIGKEATIKFFELTPDGVPRFPYAIAFRDYE